VFKLFRSGEPAPAKEAGPAAAEAQVAPEGYATGCVVCGKELVYLPASGQMTCALCGTSSVSAARCAAGHYVCDACHAAPAKDVIEKICAATDEKDPIAIARRIFRHPAVKLHGPEHHFLVPAVLVAAYSNAKGEAAKRAARVAEVRKRSDPLLGGFCGLQGACGAAIGTGTFVAIATESTPLKGKQRALSNRMTARALTVVASTEAARCCKRDSMLSILAAAKFAAEHLGVRMNAHGAACEWSGVNTECGGAACPFKR
jgi:Family of unknown function (DUF5714)